MVTLVCEKIYRDQGFRRHSKNRKARISLDSGLVFLLIFSVAQEPIISRNGFPQIGIYFWGVWEGKDREVEGCGFPGPQLRGTGGTLCEVWQGR